MLAKQKKSQPGRPAGRNADQVRRALLDAASQLFLRYEFKAVSVRKIAALAGVNPAMVHYYFGDKQGLYLAMVDSTFMPLKAELEKLDAHSELSIEEFVRLYSELMVRNPWWPNFFVREVLFGREELREIVVGKFSQVVIPRVLGLIRQGQQEGRFRAGLKPEMVMMSLLGMTVFPFLVRPLARQVLDYSLEDATVSELIKHTRELFLYGVTEQGHES